MQLPPEAGVMILNTVLFPQAVLPLHIFEPRYRRMLDDTLQSCRMFIVAMQRPGTTRESPCPVAGLGLVRAAVKNANGTSNLVLQGVARVKLTKLIRYKPYRQYRIEPLSTPPSESLVADALTSRALELVETRLKQGFPLPVDLLKQIKSASGRSPEAQDIPGLPNTGDPGLLADFLACLLLRNNPPAMQTVLESLNVEARLKHLVQFLMGEVLRHQNQSPSEL